MTASPQASFKVSRQWRRNFFSVKCFCI
jgi:hypothetical protein